MNYRRAILLATIRAHGGTWNTSRAMRTYEQQDLADKRSTARKDLAWLARNGHLATSTTSDGNHAYTTPPETPA